MTTIHKETVSVSVKQKANTFTPALKYKIVSDDTVTFTKAAAFKFLELKQFEGERAVRERHVQFLMDEWTGQRFLWQNVVLASARTPDGIEYRINGQHTCWMRVNIPERNEPLGVEVRTMVYSVQDDDQLRILYSSFDRGAPRTQGHIGRVMLLGSKAAAEIRPSLLNVLITGFKIYWAAVKWKREQMSVNDWCGIIDNNYADIFNVVGRFLTIHVDESRFIKRAAVVGAMIATFGKNVLASEEFWTPVCSGVNLTSKTDPRLQLRNYLDVHGHNNVGGRNVVSSEEMYCVALNMWNHWRRGDRVTVVKGLIERPQVSK